jgi:hypothetical protein
MTQRDLAGLERKQLVVEQVDRDWTAHPVLTGDTEAGERATTASGF